MAEPTLADVLLQRPSHRRYKDSARAVATSFDRPVPHDSDIVERAGLLPLGTYANGMTGVAWPGFIANPITGMLAALSGGIEPGTEAFREAGINAAGAAMTGGFAKPKRGAAGMEGGRAEKKNWFHGSPEPIRGEFDLSRVGETSGHTPYVPVMFLTNRRDVAKFHGSNVSSIESVGKYKNVDMSGLSFGYDRDGMRGLKKQQQALLQAKAQGYDGVDFLNVKDGGSDSIVRAVFNPSRDAKVIPSVIDDMHLAAQPKGIRQVPTLASVLTGYGYGELAAD